MKFDVRDFVLIGSNRLFRRFCSIWLNLRLEQCGTTKLVQPHIQPFSQMVQALIKLVSILLL